MKLQKLFIVSFALILLTGCASMSGDASAPDAGVPQVDTTGMQSGCFHADQVEDLDVLSTVNLIVYAPTRSRPFLLTISPPAKFMGGNMAGGFRAGDAGGRVCGRVGDNFIMREGVARSFQIVNVRELDTATAEQMVSEARAGTLSLVVPQAAD
jgi:hypothetical protein